MKPENTSVQVGPEQLPLPPEGSGDRIPVLPTPEGGIETGVDRKEQTAEAQAAAADAVSTGAPISTAAEPVATDDGTAKAAGPVVASNDDVIEKEWVDKAKSIVNQTRNDPHKRTEEVNELQRDYLKKRYGKELGVAGQA